MASHVHCPGLLFWWWCGVHTYCPAVRVGVGGSGLWNIDLDLSGFCCVQYCSCSLSLSDGGWGCGRGGGMSGGLSTLLGPEGSALS
ncbi:hypothetical protein GCM10028815_34760 [Mariniluteicoccus flavus]